MIVTSTGIIDGYIQDRFGKRGTDFNEAGVPSRSLPLSISGYPEGTVCFAFLSKAASAWPDYTPIIDNHPPLNLFRLSRRVICLHSLSA